MTKEQIIEILENHAFNVYQHGEVISKSDFDNIADIIVKNLNIPAVIRRSEQLFCNCEIKGSSFQLDDGTECCCKCEKERAK